MTRSVGLTALPHFARRLSSARGAGTPAPQNPALYKRCGAEMRLGWKVLGSQIEGIRLEGAGSTRSDRGMQVRPAWARALCCPWRPWRRPASPDTRPWMCGLGMCG